VHNDPEFDLNQIQSFVGSEKYCRESGDTPMTRVFLVALITSCVMGTAMAQSCETKAISAEGKPLHGAAKTSFIRKCKLDACESKAVSADGKPLHGAAKNSFMAKCKKSA
jgi:hypothetical protein